ncbi:MAG: hypothetical protein PVG14_05825 [Anaerolineales bacterium]|jgi:hypothetical protein
MADFLTNLLMRHQGQVEVVRPRLPGLFEPWSLGETHAPLETPETPSRTRKEPPKAVHRSERGSEKVSTAPVADAAEPSSVRPAPQRAAMELAHPDIQMLSRSEASFSKRGPDSENPAMVEGDTVPSRNHLISATSAPSAPVTQEKHLGLREQIPRDEKLTPERGETPAVRSGDLRPAEKGEHHPAAAVPQRDALPDVERSEIPTEVAARLRQAAYREGEPPQGGRSTSEGEAAPTVRVTIGRVEVRALEPPSTTPPRAAAQRRGPNLSLDEYLSKRDGGS